MEPEVTGAPRGLHRAPSHLPQPRGSQRGRHWGQSSRGAGQSRSQGSAEGERGGRAPALAGKGRRAPGEPWAPSELLSPRSHWRSSPLPQQAAGGAASGRSSAQDLARFFLA